MEDIIVMKEKERNPFSRMLFCFFLLK